MASSIAGPIIGLSPAVELGVAAASCINCVADAPAGVPEGWPKFLDEPMAWVGPQFMDESEYIYTLSESDLREAENALLVLKALGLDGDCVSRDNFPVPTLGPQLDRIRRDVRQGKGFGVICGLDPQKYSVEDLTVLYLGIQSYIANRYGRQDRKGNMLVHIVADNSSKLKAGHHRYSTSPITFHNEEAGHLVSWLTRSTAVSGGKCIIASVYTVYNVLAVSRPDMIRTLSRSDWPFALPRFQCRPVLFPHKGRVLMNFRRVALTGNASRYYTLGFLVLFIVSAMASAIDTGLTTATSLNFLSSTPTTFTLKNSLPGYSWPKTLQDAQDPLSNTKSASVALDVGRGPLLLENGNFEVLVGIISLCSKDGWGRNLSQSNYQAKLQTKPTGDNPWAPSIDTVVALLSLMVAVLGLVPAYFNAFLAWRT